MSNLRYTNQITFADFGEESATKLKAASCVIIGVGALGCEISQWLVRAGVGKVSLVDRDFVELKNLHRQTLFFEEDVQSLIPKAEAAKNTLLRANSECVISSYPTHFGPENALSLIAQHDLVIDASDNISTRFLINDACVSLKKPWIYSAVVAGRGALSFFSPDFPCLRCYIPTIPGQGDLENCDTSGIVGSNVGAIASLAASLAFKHWLKPELLRPEIIYFDHWSLELEKYPLTKNAGCPCCELRQFDFLDRKFEIEFLSLCGKNSVHVHIYGLPEVNIQSIADTIRSSIDPNVAVTDFLIKFKYEDLEFFVFADGRAIVNGTQDRDRVKSIYQKLVQG